MSASIFGALLAADELVPISCPSRLADRYELQELIALGSRSWVYRARDMLLSSEQHEEIVAVKVYRVSTGGDRECHLSKRVRDQNVLRVLDRGETPEGYLFIVTDFVPDGDLSQQAVPWEPRRAAEFVGRLARTVQSAHNCGVVHCDIKPANILVTSDGTPRLADFELAIRMGEADSRVRGTRSFMSPEQESGEPDGLTPLSDVYAIGGVLFYLLTGELPNDFTPAHRHAKLVSALAGVRCRRSAELVEVCTAAMAPSRSDRYQSAEAIATDLDNWLGLRAVTRASPSVSRDLWLAMRRHPGVASAMIGAGALILALSVGAVWWRAETVRREMATKLKADRIAMEQVENTKAMLRDQIKLMSSVLLAGSGGDADAVLPALAWLDWIGAQPMFQPDGAISPNQRLASLASLRTPTTPPEHSIERLVLTFAIGQLQLSKGNAEKARVEFAWILDRWQDRLDPGDLLLARTRLLLACAECELSRQPDTSESCRAAEELHREIGLKALGSTDALYQASMERSRPQSSAATPPTPTPSSAPPKAHAAGKARFTR